MSMSNVAFKIFGERLRTKGENYVDFQKKLKQAQMPISYEMYMSSVYLYSIITGVIGAVVGLIASYIYVAVIGLPEQMTKIQLNDRMAWLFEFREILTALVIVVVCIAGIGGLTYLVLKTTPAVKASGRKSSIDKILPYAVTFMYALSRGGMNLVEVFKALANSSDTYGEVSKEVATIITDMEYFGYDMRTAIQRSIESTPSPKFQDLMHSLLTVIDSGGNVVAFFSDKSEQYLDQAVVEQQGFLATLELIAESYVTAFVAGPLFIIVIQTVMSVMGSAQTMALYAIIYAMIPIGSIAFVFMIYIMTPADMGAFVPLETHVKFDDTEIPFGSVDEELTEQLEKDKKGLSLKHSLRHPIQPIRENPLKVLIISGPAALIFLMIGIYLNLGTPDFANVLDDYLVFMTFILITPLVFFYEAKKKRENKVKKQFPEFLHKLAITNEIGMTLPQSIEMMAKSDTSSMSSEVKKIWNDIDWGLDVSEAFIRFANRLKMASVGRTVTLLTRAFKSSGDITDVLTITSKDARVTNKLERDRSTSMLIYVVIIFMSFMVFTIVILILSSSFLPVMAEAGSGMSSTGQAAGGQFMGSFDPEFYYRIFFHAAILQGLSSGLVAGQMGEGKFLSGLKYSIIMMAIGYLIFFVAI